MGDFRTKGFDSYTYAQASIESDHYMIHRGKFFTAYQTTSSLGASSWVDFYFITSTSGETHLKQLDVTMSGGLSEVYICEGGTTMTIGATTSASYNRDRNSTIASELSLYKNTTWGTTGGITSTQSVVISHFYVGSTGTVATRIGGSESNSLEWILKQGTTYIVRVYNQGAAGAASLRIHYYSV